jgi:hypothetical protein
MIEENNILELGDLSFLTNSWFPLKICAAPDCNRYVVSPHFTTKYCTKTCKHRHSAQRHYKLRREIYRRSYIKNKEKIKEHNRKYAKENPIRTKAFKLLSDNRVSNDPLILAEQIKILQSRATKMEQAWNRALN